MLVADIPYSMSAKFIANLRRHKYVDIRTMKARNIGQTRIVARYDPNAKPRAKALIRFTNKEWGMGQDEFGEILPNILPAKDYLNFLLSEGKI